MGRFLLDTNIFVYAHDPSDPVKTSIARKLIRKAHQSSEGFISEQVMREFCNVATSKFRAAMRTEDIIAALQTELRPLLPSLAAKKPELLYEAALRLRERYSLSFYDAAIIQAASQAQCGVVYSEDMQHGACYAGVTVVNPFITQ